ncbi:hypothetical protein PHYSODRAFT_332235 [Phytophthora sojae]|uniref:Sugar phosphate phosphatase n=1 Tax=Phytophthora sojae (strain P6497) TaxID=1094619 RepID=G4ZEI1_PHYSP|nr:hypothetical protein PHYSODRAFT_332235 [Phytophthora sojae]EGZ18446.1 hypothetical protein PHYSODRAFT_332235 [Phytophthora sojae]|eukprot:XP_009527504.1 hypothetical protein PHYSODRAFT_332235 [Phytophthora sojae]
MSDLMPPDVVELNEQLALFQHRTLKSNLVVGIPADVVDKLEKEDVKWRYNGKRGTIQSGNIFKWDEYSFRSESSHLLFHGKASWQAAEGAVHGGGAWAMAPQLATGFVRRLFKLFQHRTLKSNLVVGIPADVVDKLEKEDVKWRYNGKRGTIQSGNIFKWDEYSFRSESSHLLFHGKASWQAAEGAVHGGGAWAMAPQRTCV